MLSRCVVVLAAAVVAAPPAAGVPIVGGNGLTPNAWALAEYIRSVYPGVQSIGGVRSDPLPDHPSGHAIDVMVGGNTALGNQIYADVMGNPGRFGISYALWLTAGHADHIHFTVA